MQALPSLSIPQDPETTWDNANNKLLELQKISPQFEALWRLVQSQLVLQDWWESGEDLFRPAKSITSALRDNKQTLKTLREIPVVAAKEELGRYGITQFNELDELHYSRTDYGKITDDPSFDWEQWNSIYKGLLAYRQYYNPETDLTEDERADILHQLCLGNYLALLYNKIQYLGESQQKLEEAKQKALHLLDDEQVRSLYNNNQFPEKWDTEPFFSESWIVGNEYTHNSRNDTKEIRRWWREIAELWHARILQIDIQKAIHAINIVHDRAIDAFPGVSMDNPQYIQLQEKTKMLLGDLKEAMEDLQWPLWSIENRLWK